MNNSYFFSQIINIINGEIRIIDSDGNIVKKYANSELKGDKLSSDSSFLKSILDRDKLDMPDIICDNDYIYYAKIDFSEGVLLVGPVQVKFIKKEIPFCNFNTFLNCVLLIYNYLTCKEIAIDELCKRNFINKDTKSDDELYISEKVFDTQENGILHNPYNHETRKLEYIKNGNVEKLKECQHESWTGRIGKVADNPIRQEKNIGIIVIVLASRAAISGGMSPELAFTMADAFIMRIENMDNLMQIRASIFEYELEFARYINSIITF